ncbi:MAG TPA: glycoside hydrolase family 2 TIM barrel-domain containing protein [Terriglobales bacterium]|nr:glycoside hydrolase family 2 TIM barrel-domain containing protein [Terriglobales bacterium]
MNRRDFVKAGSAALASFSLLPDELALPSPTSPSAGRLVLSINRNWRFSAQRAQNDTAVDFDDSKFDQVCVPHTNKMLPWHDFDEKSYQFVSIYRRKFRLPAETRERHVFVDFDGAMTASTVWINGQRLGEYKGGYTPFSFDLTPHLHGDGDNLLAVELDSTERADIPPFGGEIDYLTFGGIYRDVRLRIVPLTYLENIFAKPKDVLTDHPSVDVSCFVARLAPQQGVLTLEAELRDGDRVVAHASKQLPAGATSAEPTVYDVSLAGLGTIRKWDLTNPNLYTVVVRLKQRNTIVDEDQRRIGFRQAQFTDHGFELNGQVIKLRGLDRHQTFPFVGQAMAARGQRRDAYVLKRELKCNIVRTSHYPQSPYFLDACDELGLLVFEEIPGWQHIGDEPWQAISVDNVRRMIRRDWNHPSVILWGVRINESRDNHDFYVKTNAMAHSLDSTRPTGGVRYLYESELLEDVFTMNDFGFPLRPPNHPRYLNTEFCGHTYPTKMYDPGDRLAEHIRRHARVHNQLASNAQYAGGLGWCAFDYDTHEEFGSGDRICYHGVSDIFRLPKPAAYFYASQADPAEEIVLEPAFQWSAAGDWSQGMEKAIVCSNCDHLKFYVGDRLAAEADPDKETFGNLPHPPFTVKLDNAYRRTNNGTLRIEGYIGGKKVIEKQFAHSGVDKQFILTADDKELMADGGDSTRVAMRIADEFGNLRRYSTASIELSLEGPAEIIGENPFSLVGGCGAVWVRARQEAGTAVLKAKHPVLGTKEVQLQISSAEPERV